MSRKMMQRLVTLTHVELTRFEVVDGKPVLVPLEPTELVGSYETLPKAQKEIDKLYNNKTFVHSVNVFQRMYEMPMEQFLKLATIRQEKSESETEGDE